VENGDLLMTTDQVAASGFIPAKSQTLRIWRVKGKGPTYVKINKKVFYRLSDIRAWIDQRTRTSTKEPSAP